MLLRYILAILLVLFPAFLEASAYRYAVYWGGFEVASLVVGFNKKGEVFEVKSQIKTYGIAAKASKYHSDSIAITKYVPGKVLPQEFATDFRMKNRFRKIRLKWDNSWKLVRNFRDPAEDPGKRPPVEKRFLSQVYDPLSVYFVAKEHVKKGAKEFAIPMYDGRRRSILKFKNLGPVKGGNLHITMREEFVSGFTEREAKDRAERDITIHIYVNPKTYIPEGGYGESLIGRADGKLVAVCNNIEECQ